MFTTPMADMNMAVIRVGQSKFTISRRSSMNHPSSDLGGIGLEATWAGEGEVFFTRL